jgi:GNAT superfamily N-acetyltransferase
MTMCTIRRACSADGIEVALAAFTLLELVERGDTAELASFPGVDRLSARYADALLRDDHLFLVVERDGLEVGHAIAVQYGPGRQLALLDAIYVLPELRGLGLEQALRARVRSWCDGRTMRRPQRAPTTRMASWQPAAAMA